MKKNETVNLKRRNFLKFLVLGSGAFVLGGFLTKISGIGEDPLKKAVRLRNFEVLDKDKELIFYNNKGHRLFTVYDNGDLEID